MAPPNRGGTYAISIAGRMERKVARLNAALRRDVFWDHRHAHVSRLHWLYLFAGSGGTKKVVIKSGPPGSQALITHRRVCFVVCFFDNISTFCLLRRIVLCKSV